MFLGQLGEFFQRLHRLLEFLGKLFVFLILSGIAQRREPRVQQRHPVFQIAVEPLQLLGEPPHFFRVHDCLGHIFVGWLLA